MGRLLVFNSISLDGYFVDMNGDMRWAHPTEQDDEWDAFVEGNAQGEGVLVFGRITYELMEGFWPTAMAIERYPVVAKQMNSLPKIVFSRTLDRARWNNTRLVRDGMAAEIRRMKHESAEDMVILGSGSIVAQLSEEQLIDEYQIVVVPVVLGEGRTLFRGMKGKLHLTLIDARTFANGNILVRYLLKS